MVVHKKDKSQDNEVSWLFALVAVGTEAFFSSGMWKSYALKHIDAWP